MNTTFDPALFLDPSLPETPEPFRVEALKKHLWRYGGQQSAKNVLARLEDSLWLATWDSALATLKGARVLLRGSELGVFALRALHHGAEQVWAVEGHPPDGRIATGMVHKHFLAGWHARYGEAIQGWPEDQRKRSFESFARNIEIVSPDAEQLSSAQCDCFVFPHLDHSLLGTGIVKAIRYHQTRGLAAPTRILPAKARIFALGIQWTYPAVSFDLRPLNQLRWSLYPEPLEDAREHWIAVTAPVEVGEIDFANFSEALWDVDLPVVTAGRIDAILFWFELDLAGARITNAPDSSLSCIKPGVQYTDPQEVNAGDLLGVQVHVTANRLHFQTRPAASQLRSHGLPGWYIPMLQDKHRNEAYRSAIDLALTTRPAQVVLDIGAGCGLLSMMAAASGATRVVGSEVHPAICRIGSEIVRLNRLDERITLINKECRSIKVPEDLPQRADLAVFELFDCSLIGEGVLHFLAYAREHLLTQNARYLPARARLRAQVIEYRLDKILGIDANLLNPYRFSPAFINVSAEQLVCRPLTEPFEPFSFDFATAGPTPEAKELVVPTCAAGTAGAVLFWFDLQLDETQWLSNAPGKAGAAHWKQGLQFLPEVRVDSAQALPLLAKHDGSSLTFHWQRDMLPQEGFSTLPRFDPRWLAATNELEQQTRGLLQHCMRNVDEYTKVAELAKHFALDPATHDLEPVVAQRFAALFFR